MPKGFLLIVCLFLLGACTQRMVCPAYQSSFIYDKEAVKKRFSYFQPDSTPKVYTASKSRYLIAVPESYRKKYRKMQTVEMTPVYPSVPDSIKQQEEYALAEADPTDSLAGGKGAAADTVYAITKTKEKYNLDQDLYMWYFREMLVLPDVRAALEKKNEAKNGGTGETKKSKGIKGFFQNLFKKKPKNDSTGVASPPASLKEGPEAEEPKKKKGGLFKKKEKQPADKQPAKKEGDGF